MKFLFTFALILPLLAEDIPPPKPTVEELTTENERLTKMLNAYAQKYQRCDQELTVQMTLGVQPTQAAKPIQRPANGSTASRKRVHRQVSGGSSKR